MGCVQAKKSQEIHYRANFPKPAAMQSAAQDGLLRTPEAASKKLQIEETSQMPLSSLTEQKPLHGKDPEMMAQMSNNAQKYDKQQKKTYAQLILENRKNRDETAQNSQISTSGGPSGTTVPRLDLASEGKGAENQGNLYQNNNEKRKLGLHLNL